MAKEKKVAGEKKALPMFQWKLEWHKVPKLTAMDVFGKSCTSSQLMGKVWEAAKRHNIVNKY